MFDPLVPYDQLPLLPTDFNYDQVPLLKAVNKAHIAMARLNIRSEKIPNSMLLINPLLVRESVASSGIENIHTTVEEVFAAELLQKERRSGPAKEVLHYRDAMLYGIEIIRKKRQLTIKDIVSIQAIVEPGHAGLRKQQVKIIDHNSREVLFTPPSPGSLTKFLENLVSVVNDPSMDIDPLMKAAVIHYQFECIHPFTDGNGRVGRIIILLYLMLMGRLQMPIIYLSDYIEKNRSQYYQVLRNSSKTNDFFDLISLFLHGFEVQALQSEQAMIGIESLMMSCKDIIENTMTMPSSDLLRCIFSHPFLTIDTLQKGLGLSARQTASSYLQELVSTGFLQEKKVGRQKLFYSRKFCQLLA